MMSKIHRTSPVLCIVFYSPLTLQSSVFFSEFLVFVVLQHYKTMIFGDFSLYVDNVLNAVATKF